VVIKASRNQWGQLGTHLAHARHAAGLTQGALAVRSGLRQKDISLIETGHWQPSLRILTNIARHLDVSLQYFIIGQNQPEEHPHQLTLELRNLGIIDLDSSQAIVPGAFREREQVLALSLTGDSPDPRVIEALPYVLLLHSWDAETFIAFSKRFDKRAHYRAAWLIQIALIIRDELLSSRNIRREQALERIVMKARKSINLDDLGYPSNHPDKLSHIYRRWNIDYATTIDEFLARGKKLHELTKTSDRRIVNAIDG
jgi:transcriptional regulator with XRE-family HTH domain